ncbi:MAG: DNA internalization-related competence protein ComEC/Rec2 [Steroidobacteraceae bacterium]|nr:DNA internalization-related competence protein ComEC/Rec2 [Steroidobacteraceae bacterium]
MVTTALGFLGGTCLLLSLPALPAEWIVAAGVLVAASLALVARQPAPLAFAVGFAWCWIAVSGRLEQRLDPALEGSYVELRGSVASVPQLLEAGTRFRFATAPAPGVPPLVELTWYDEVAAPKAAERMVLIAKLRRPRGFSNPGGYDQEARLLREGIGASGYVKSAVVQGRDWSDIARSPVLTARGAIADAIRDALGTRPATGIVAGLAVGLQDALSREQWRELARSGTSHLMAISGMHIGMFATVTAWLTLRVQRWRQRRGSLGARRDPAVLAGTLAAFGYSLLAGWSVPTQRTMIMIAMVAVALLLRRRVGVADALALGAIAVLLLDPLAPLAVGFWLSFGAVAAILLASTGGLANTGIVAGFAQAQLAVTVGLVPVLAACFGNVSLVSALVNIAAIPLYTLIIVPAILVATALALAMPSVGTVALGGIAWVIEFTWPLISAPAAWPLATWGVASLPAWGWIALVAGAVAAMLPLPAPGRVAGALVVAAFCAWRAAPPAPGSAHFALLDVGQGLAAVVETRRHVLVYDSGPAFRSGTDTGVLVVEPYLRSRGSRQVDLLVASHDDGDHTGGSASLAGLMTVRRFAASGGALDGLGAGSAERCGAGTRWTWDGVDFEWLHPAPPLLPKDNDRSCVLLVRAGNQALLLTGDIQRDAEAELLARGLPADIKVVVVPHHGSRTSSGQSLVDATRPRWALVPAGYRNRWGFPASSVLERWSLSGAQVLNTATSGAIEFDLGPEEAMSAPAEWRRTAQRPWRDP